MRTLRFRPRPQGVRSPSECQGSTQPRHCWCSPDTLLSYGDNDAASCRIHTVGQISPASAGQRKPCLCKEKRSKNNEKKNSRPQKDLAAQVGQSDLLAQAFWQMCFQCMGKVYWGLCHSMQALQGAVTCFPKPHIISVTEYLEVWWPE